MHVSFWLFSYHIKIDNKNYKEARGSMACMHKHNFKNCHVGMEEKSEGWNPPS
jgi:hypothetical protein